MQQISSRDIPEQFRYDWYMREAWAQYIVGGIDIEEFERRLSIALETEREL